MGLRSEKLEVRLACALDCAARLTLCVAFAASALLLLASPGFAQAINWTITNISPTQSNNNDPNSSTGGRVNKLGRHPNTPDVAFAASEWGGLFKTVDGGVTWTHVESHTPHVTWDVEYNPNLAAKTEVIATSRFDGRTQPGSLSGINVSPDGGANWARVQTPAAAACGPAGNLQSTVLANEMSAWGIAFDDARPDAVYVGTDCGLAARPNAVNPWVFLNPLAPFQPGAPRGLRIYDVISHNGGNIDLCGVPGIFRYNPTTGNFTNLGAPWGVGLPPAGAICSLAAAPGAPNILFLYWGGQLFYTTTAVDGGPPAVWLPLPLPPGGFTSLRIPFVKTNDLGGGQFDLWLGDQRLWVRRFNLPGAALGLGGGWVDATGAAHFDAGDIAFRNNPADGLSHPYLYSNDGGVYRAQWPPPGGVQAPVWLRPNQSTTALWLWDMAGLNINGAATAERILIGTQDNGGFATQTAAAAPPAWNATVGADIFDVEAEQNRSVFTWLAAGVRLFHAGIGMGAPAAVPPPCLPAPLIGFSEMNSVANFGPDQYAVVSQWGCIQFTNTILAPAWANLGNWPALPTVPCAIYATQDQNGNPVFTIKTDPAPVFWLWTDCQHYRRGEIYQKVGTAPGPWQRITHAGASNFSVFAVGPNNRNIMIAASFAGAAMQMVRTDTGGAAWAPMTELNQKMLNPTGAGTPTFVAGTNFGPNMGRITTDDPYPQPSLLAISHLNPNVYVAGGHESGVFLSMDAGQTWELLTDPIGDQADRPHIPRPFYAHFEPVDSGPNDFNLYIGTRGRGVWRINVTVDEDKPNAPGRKFNDDNRNGNWEIGYEPPIRDWYVYAYEDLNANGVLEQAEYNLRWAARDRTNAHGEYKLPLDPGKDYIIVEEKKNDWVQTVPGGTSVLHPSLAMTNPQLAENGYIITAAETRSGNIPKDLNFGNHKKERDVFRVSGVKFEDLNLDGVMNDDEPGLRDFTIIAYVDADEDKFLSQEEYEAGPAFSKSGRNDIPASDIARRARVRTDFNGVYEMFLEENEAYLVFEEAHPDFLQSTNPPANSLPPGIEFGDALRRNVPRGRDKNDDVIKLPQQGYKIAKSVAKKDLDYDFLDFGNYLAPGPRGEPCVNCVQEFCPPVEIVRGQNRDGLPERLADLSDWPERVPEAWPDEHEFGDSPPPPSTYTYRFRDYNFTQNWMFASRQTALNFSQARVMMMDRDQDWTPEKVEIECYYATSMRDRNHEQMHLVVSPRPVTDQEHTVITLRTVSFRPWTRFYEQSDHDYEYNCRGRYDACKY